MKIQKQNEEISTKKITRDQNEENLKSEDGLKMKYDLKNEDNL